MDSAGLLIAIVVIALVIQAGLAAIVAVLAKKRGKSPAGYFWLSFLLTIFIGLIVLLIQTSGTQNVRNLGLNPNLGLLNGEKVIKCSKCAEWVKVEAVVCKHCGQEIAEYISQELLTETSLVQASKVAKREILEAKNVRRENLLKKKPLRIGIALVVVILGVGAFFGIAQIWSVEAAKKPASVESVVFDPLFRSTNTPYCPLIALNFDTSSNDVRNSIISGGQVGASEGGLDRYTLIFSEVGENELSSESSRQLTGNPQSFYLTDDLCRSLAKQGNNQLKYTIKVRNEWTETAVADSGSFEFKWEKPNYSAHYRPGYFEEDIQLLPKNFASSATSISFLGLSSQESAKQTENFQSRGYLFVDEGQTYIAILTNPAGEQRITIKYGM